MKQQGKLTRNLGVPPEFSPIVAISDINGFRFLQTPILDIM